MLTSTVCTPILYCTVLQYRTVPVFQSKTRLIGLRTTERVLSFICNAGSFATQNASSFALRQLGTCFATSYLSTHNRKLISHTPQKYQRMLELTFKTKRKHDAMNFSRGLQILLLLCSTPFVFKAQSAHTICGHMGRSRAETMVLDTVPTPI